MNNTKNIFAHAAMWGVLLFICGAIVSELFLILMSGASSLIMMGVYGIALFLVILVIFFVVVIFAQRSWRKIKGGYINYGNAVGYGALLLTVSSFLSGVYNYIGLISYKRETMQNMMMKMQNWMAEMNASKEQMERSVHSMQMQLDHPFLSSLQSFGGGLLIMMIGVLITSAFIQKKQDPFQQMDQPQPPLSNS